MSSIKLDDIAAVSIIGKRWFRKTYGNTYSRVDLDIALKNGSRMLGHSEIECGYGDYYDQMAVELFKELTGLDGGKGYLSRYLKDNKVQVFTNVSDVARERDLK